MNPRLLALLMRRFRDPEPGDDGAGGADPYGNDFKPTGDDADDATRDAAAKTTEKEPEKGEKTEKASLKDGAAAGKETKEGEGDEDETDEEKEERERAEKAAAEAAKGEKEPKKDTRIPLARHKEILDKERERREALEREVEGLKKGKAVVATNEKITEIEDAIVKLEGQYNKHLADGELDKASAVMKDIRHMERDINARKTEMLTQAAEARAYERVRFDNVVDRLEEAYPVLKEGTEEYDEAVVKKVLRMQSAYVREDGYSPADALQAAAKDILGAATKKQERAVDTDVKVAKEDVAKATAEERRAAAVKRNLEVAGKQPPNTAKIGADSDKAGGSLTARDAVKLSQEEFSKLDEATLARMRGDVIA